MASRDHRMLVGDGSYARTRWRDDHLVWLEGVHETPDERQGLLLVSSIHVHLPAAGLFRRKLDLVAQPLEDRDSRLRHVREQRVSKTCGEQRDPHRGYRSFMFRDSHPPCFQNPVLAVRLHSAPCQPVCGGYVWMASTGLPGARARTGRRSYLRHHCRWPGSWLIRLSRCLGWSRFRARAPSQHRRSLLRRSISSRCGPRGSRFRAAATLGWRKPSTAATSMTVCLQPRDLNCSSRPLVSTRSEREINWASAPTRGGTCPSRSWPWSPIRSADCKPSSSETTY